MNIIAQQLETINNLRTLIPTRNFDVQVEEELLFALSLAEYSITKGSTPQGSAEGDAGLLIAEVVEFLR